jgi:hypothetical protein
MKACIHPCTLSYTNFQYTNLSFKFKDTMLQNCHAPIVLTRICLNVILDRHGCPILTLELLQLVASLPEKFALQPEKPALPWILTPEQPPPGVLKLETTSSVRYLDPVNSSFLLPFQCGDIFLRMLLRLLLASATLLIFKIDFRIHGYLIRW